MKRFLMTGLLVLATVALTLNAKGESNKYRTDPWITFTTKIALLTTDELDAHAINVDSINGVVTLHGKVDTAAAKARAEKVAAQIDGTRRVRNLLQVVPESARKRSNLNDDAILKRAAEVLVLDVHLGDSHIKVKSVNKGVLLLSGTAASLSDTLRAIRDVGAVDGVRRVASEVQSPDVLSDRDVAAEAEQAQAAPPSSEGGMKQAVSDMWITTATKSRLMADSDTPAMDINVDTEDGVVTLFGVVPTDGAKKAAEADALKVTGVKKVENDLQVVPAKEQKVVAKLDDEALQEAKTALKGHDEFKDVSVEVKNGVARLTGTVTNAGDYIMAAVVVRSCDGIRSVSNDVRVKKP
jgi:hyperosmotically inducible protein